MDIDEFLDEERGKEVSPGTYKKREYEETYIERGIDEEIGHIRELIKKGKFKDAEKEYGVVKEKYFNLTKKQEEEKVRIHNEITDINKELISTLNTLKGDVNKKALIISELIKKGENHIKEGNLKLANQLYVQIRSLFYQIPDTFVERRVEVENNILLFYKKLINEFNKSSYEHFNKMYSRINELITRAYGHLKQGDQLTLRKSYNTINDLYKKLPPGYLYEKSVLYKRILKLHEQIDISIRALAPRTEEKDEQAIKEAQQVMEEGKKKEINVDDIEAPINPLVKGGK